MMVLEADVLALALPIAPPEGWITRHAAAKVLGCTHRAVGLMVARGDLPAETINGRVYLREADVRKAATPRRVMPPRRR
ncbi:helix-turn-helix domain-containing protein [Mycobacteroides abscessus]|uniref:helix-turn-helix domain-containing protein n=1 Tax=Mycobacteroides abscessus TaxID=36809 RepID=UPI0020C3E8BF|nr:helix-turn-helix domain-containing protein [Mycobacteroides abscessus]